MLENKRITGRADLHVHSAYSFDCSTSIEVVLDQAVLQAGLDVLAITDHDTMEGAYRALDLADEYGLGIIPGCEISTKQGHLLALFLSKPVPKGLSLSETIYRVGAQGGLCIAPHPMAPHVPSLRWKQILDIQADPDLRTVLVGIETINTGLPYSFSNLMAARLCNEAGLAAAGGSDAHLSWMIGSAFTEFPGTTIDDLRTALVERETKAVERDDKRPGTYFGSTLYHTVRRWLGWTIYAPAPGLSYQWKRFAEVRELGSQVN